MTLIVGLLIVWLGVGLGLTVGTPSRGLWADALFVIAWPVHLVLHIHGKD